MTRRLNEGEAEVARYMRERAAGAKARERGERRVRLRERDQRVQAEIAAIKAEAAERAR